MLLEFKGDIKYFTSNDIVEADGSSQSSNNALIHGQNVVNVTLPVSSFGGAKVNENAIFCIFGLNQKISPYPHEKSLNIYRNIPDTKKYLVDAPKTKHPTPMASSV